MVKYAYPFTDPVGAKAPKFSTNDKSSSFVFNSGEGFGLLCPAQGFPVPTFRYVSVAMHHPNIVQEVYLSLKCNVVSAN